MCCATSPALADSGAGSASVTVAQPVHIERDADLYFGGFMRGPGFGTGDTIEVLSSGGAPNYSNVSHFIPIFSHPTHPAKFTISGAPGFDVSVQLPAPNLSIGAGMRVQNIFADVPHGTAFTMPPSGSVDYFMGGRLQVMDGAAVTAGEHGASFTLTVNYQ